MRTLEKSAARGSRHRMEDLVKRGILEVGRSTAGQLLFRSGYQETADRVTLESLGLDHPDRGAYSASPWWVLRWLLPRSDVRPSDVFVEFGCGKGRVVLDAARRYPFRRVVGVELAADLSDVARRLVAGERSRLRCRDVTIETVDATEYSIPDDMTHAYLYNPFSGPTFERVCANILASLDRVPRPLQVIYVYPEEHETLAATGRFRLVRRVQTTRLVFPVKAAIYKAA
jgi:SAM-dependent methyltransferase